MTIRSVVEESAEAELSPKTGAAVVGATVVAGGIGADPLYDEEPGTVTVITGVGTDPRALDGYAPGGGAFVVGAVVVVTGAVLGYDSREELAQETDAISKMTATSPITIQFFISGSPSSYCAATPDIIRSNTKTASVCIYDRILKVLQSVQALIYLYVTKHLSKG